MLEIRISQIDIGLFFIYLIIAMICVPLVRFLGPVSITSYGLEETYDSETGYLNVLYRVISPVLCCGILALIVSAILEASVGFSAVGGWISVLLYWAIVIAIKAKKRTLSGKMTAIILELVVSVLISYLFNEFVIAELLDGNFGILDSSNYAIQMELALLYAIIQFIVSLFVRINYRVGFASLQSSRDAFDDEPGWRHYSSIDTSEKKLFSYVNSYGKLLPLRYEQDPLLWDIFFSIMAIEDSNRPPAVRLLERLVYRLGFSKTTGIMQQDGGKPLTDEESVRLAAGYIERMWDSYLRAYAKSVQSREHGLSISFGRTWYKYDYQILANELETSFASLYGDYCGTRLLNADFVFCEVREFEERNHYGLLPDCIVASASLFEMESGWLSGREAFWESAYSIRLETDDEEAWDKRIILYREGVVLGDIDNLCLAINDNGGRILKIEFAEKCFAKVICENIEKVPLDKLGPQWEMVG